MTIAFSFFEASLKPPTKCWLRFTGEPTAGNTYAEWVQAEYESYRADGAKRLKASATADNYVFAAAVENLKTAHWRFAVDVPCELSFVAAEVTRLKLPRPQSIRASLRRLLRD